MLSMRSPGGVTAVINASACGVIETARKYRHKIGKVYAGRNGIIGALTEDMIDTSKESAATIAALRHTPGGAFGSARYKLKGLDVNRAEYERLIEVFRAHNIGYFFYNGGGDSADTCYKVSQLSKKMGSRSRPSMYRRPSTTTCRSPTRARDSARSPNISPSRRAKPRSTSNRWPRHRRRSSCWKSWADTRAGSPRPAGSPATVAVKRRISSCFPKSRSTRSAFLKRVKQTVRDREYCVIVVSEGAAWPDGRFLADAGRTDAFGHKQLGGVAQVVAQMVSDELGLKYHYAIADYLQRSARHIASATDVKQAYAVGKAAVELALAGENAVMPAIRRKSDRPYRWTIETAPLGRVANREKMMPKRFITKGRLRHHGRLPPLSRTADRRGGLPALCRGPAEIRPPEEYPGRQKAENQFCAMIAR